MLSFEVALNKAAAGFTRNPRQEVVSTAQATGENLPYVFACLKVVTRLSLYVKSSKKGNSTSLATIHRVGITPSLP